MCLGGILRVGMGGWRSEGAGIPWSLRCRGFQEGVQAHRAAGVERHQTPHTLLAVLRDKARPVLHHPPGNAVVGPPAPPPHATTYTLNRRLFRQSPDRTAPSPVWLSRINCSFSSALRRATWRISLLCPSALISNDPLSKKIRFVLGLQACVPRANCTVSAPDVSQQAAHPRCRILLDQGQITASA